MSRSSWRRRAWTGPAPLIRYGHFGRPVLVFPSEQGRAWDYENNGMVGAVADLIEAGRVKLYCVDSFDHLTWSDRSVPLEERARRHGAYESWITDQVVAGDRRGLARAPATSSRPAAAWAPTTRSTSRSSAPTCSRSRSASPATTTRRSGTAWGERGDATYFNNPTDYVPNLDGDHLDWLRGRVFVVLTVGQGAWETHPTGSLPSARGWRRSCGQGHPARARRVGPRRRPRLALVAAAARPPPAPLLLSRTLPDSG